MLNKTLNISEVFTSIQGESTYAGLLCCFIRLAGCNLNCRYCDTGYARHSEQGQEKTIIELVNAANQAQTAIVEITGGEPLFQENTPLLAQELINHGHTVLIETNGSLPIAVLPEEAIKILDCKTPSSKMADQMDVANFAALSQHDEVKFVIANFADYDYAVEIIEKYQLLKKTGKLLFSPVWNEISPKALAERIIKDKVKVRFQLQLHKLIWEPDARGV